MENVMGGANNVQEDVKQGNLYSILGGKQWKPQLVIRTSTLVDNV